MEQTHQYCLYCGASLEGLCQRDTRKYCSRLCKGRAEAQKKFPNRPHKLWQHEPEVFENAMEMYWEGIGSAAIARHFGISVGTVYSWVHDFGMQRERSAPFTPLHLMPLREQFRLAGNAEEWLAALRESTLGSNASLEDSPVHLVCGKLQWQSADKLATVVFERLKDNPLGGKVYAFCNKRGNTITTLSWKNPIYRISQYIKISGTFIWPHEDLGVAAIKITRMEFEHLISLKKHEKSFKMLDFMQSL